MRCTNWQPPAGVGAEVTVESLPVHPAVRLVHADEDVQLSTAVGASDDYELLFAVPKRRLRGFRAAARAARATVTQVGALRAQPGVTLVQDGRERPWPAGYEHFAV